MLFGNVAAFLCITKMGAMPSMPDRTATNTFIEEFDLTIKKEISNKV
jgi:sugar/nucleoside kinase (ribokinase family)